MVHYIRLLRTPQVGEAPKHGLIVSAVATVTTDLGDAFFGQDVQLVVRVVDATGAGEMIATNFVQWQGYQRALKLSLSCSAQYLQRLVRLHITTDGTTSTLAASGVPAILDVWSEAFVLKPGTRTEPYVERLLFLPGRSRLRQTEETGDSIARHIWDASLGFLLLFQQTFSATKCRLLPGFAHRLLDSPTTRIKVLEVGAGCGVVGIALAQLRKADVVLTDLEDAQDILQSNVARATVLAGSSLRRQVLAWGPSIAALSEPRFDVVLVSDCIYNPDSSLLLVDTLLQIANYNPHVSILVGFKRRHDADDIFFERMQTTGFSVAETCDIALPHTMTEDDAAEPKVEMFVYQAVRPTSSEA